MKPLVGMPGVGGSLGSCALCGEDFLYEILTNTNVETFEIESCHNTLVAHKKCLKEHNGKGLSDLPERSPLRIAFEKAARGGN